MRSLSLIALLLIAGCPELSQLNLGGPAPKPPRIVVSGVTLAGHPGPDVIARALCPRIAPAPVCMILGGMPSPYELRITFALGLDVTNDNAFPLPLVDALVAFTAYPQATGGQRLGAVCLSFCNSDGPCPAAAGACTSGGPGIRTMNDFAGAAVGFLAAVATGQEAVGNLKIRTIAAGATAHVTVALQLEPMQILALMEQFAGTALDSVKRGQTPSFQIPYAVEGTAWVTVEHFGKIAAGFGPVQGAWSF
jgi:hypothetical protein